MELLAGFWDESRPKYVNPVNTIDMQTSGEPTRILVGGYPELRGRTLLEKRRYAREHHDNIRKRLMREPRGHAGMYGVILVQDTKLTEKGDADIGVLFCHNEGYSTMCGHATIALGRFLVDTHDLSLFPRRGQLEHDVATGVIHIRLHTPCGVVNVSVPTKDGQSDGSRPVSYLRVPSFITALGLKVPIPSEKRWKQLVDVEKNMILVDVVYGGAFYVIVSAEELGFVDGFRGNYELPEFDRTTAIVKEIFQGRKELYRHPREADLEFLYGVVVVDKTIQGGAEGGGETSLCYFGDQQVDRSPTGSCVSARIALAVKRGWLQIGESWNCESMVSLEQTGIGFKGTGVKMVDEGLIVRVEGRAFYTGASSFVAEDQDGLADGFVFSLPK